MAKIDGSSLGKGPENWGCFHFFLLFREYDHNKYAPRAIELYALKIDVSGGESKIIFELLN